LNKFRCPEQIKTLIDQCRSNFYDYPKESQLVKNKPKSIIVSPADESFEVMESVEDILKMIGK